MRCFVAIRPTEDVLDRLESLASLVPVGRTPPRDNLHLTLAFLDELAPEDVNDIHQALSEITHPPVPVAFQGIDLFGTSRPVILHAVVEADPLLVHLHEKIVQAARGCGIALKRRRFRPHVTLARFNRAPAGADAQRLGAFLAANAMSEIPGFQAKAFSLYQSRLGGGPARHDELASYPLDA